MKKTRLSSRRAKNTVVDSFIRTIDERQSFLMTGHKSPDEDCIASMVAFSLLRGLLASGSVQN